MWFDPRKSLPAACPLPSRLVCPSSSSSLLPHNILLAANLQFLSIQNHTPSSVVSLLQSLILPFAHPPPYVPFFFFFFFTHQHCIACRHSLPLGPIPLRSLPRPAHSFPAPLGPRWSLSISVVSRIYIIASWLANRSHPSQTFIASE